MPSHYDVLCVILGGGRGTRLWPLTKSRAKPAVPIGGKYRLIDIALSNCLNSGLTQIAVLTQFNSVSLHRHIAQTYHFDFFHSGWVHILAAEQTNGKSDWYQGTADAVRKQLAEILAPQPEFVLILAGDHLYRMDFVEMLEYHRAQAADITVAVKPVSRAEASRFGILRQGVDHRITAFTEKPATSDDLSGYVTPGDSALPFMGSMGIYLFRTEALVALLDSAHADFGSQLIPAAIPSYRVVGYRFDGYWEDIGTIRSFYEANLALAQPDPPFGFHDTVRPIYTHPRFLPASRMYDVHLDRVFLADGCVAQSAGIRNSLIGNRSVIDREVLIEDTVMMGADYYEEEAPQQSMPCPSLGVGRGCRIKGAIIDKNARIGSGVTIEPFPSDRDIDEANWTVRDGIVVVPKNAVIPAGTVIAPG